MSTMTGESQRAAGTPASLSHTPARATTLVLVAFGAVYVVWGSTYLAIRIGVESFPPLILPDFATLQLASSFTQSFAGRQGLSLQPHTGAQRSSPEPCCSSSEMVASAGRN